MSSFNIYDNYNSFDDLFNRVEFLEEKDFKSMVKGSNLANIVSKYGEKGAGLDTTGKPVSPIGTKSRVKNLVNLIAMLEMDIIDQQLFNKLIRVSPSSTNINTIIRKEAPDVYKELFEGDSPKSEDVVKYIEKDKDKKVQFTVINHMNKNKEYVRFDEDDVEKAKEEIADEIEDDMDKEVKIAKGLIGKGGTIHSKEIDAKISELDFDDVDVNIEGLDNKEDVAAKIAELINTTNNLKAEPTGVGLNIEGPIGIFGSEEKVSDQMTRLITKYFPAVRESEVKVTLNTNEEDYEYQEGQGITEPEETNAYAMGEEGDGITEVEDAEDLSAKKARAGKDIGKPGKNFSKIAKSAGKKYGSKAAGERVAGAVLAKMRGNYEGAEDEFNIKFSVGSVGGQHGQIMMKDKTFDSLEDACNHAGVDVRDCISGEWDDMGDGTKEYGVDEDTVIIMHAASEDNEFDDFDIGPQSDEDVPDDYEEVLKAMVTKDKEDLAKDMIEDEERINEAIEMQPHLEVSETSTAAYLTEQKQSDKRNKKTETKNQSFKEKYKPKTHWQLEELRRYGL